jgi:hypothetical protein
MYQPNIISVAIMSHIRLILGPVLGTTGITVLVTAALLSQADLIVNLISSHQSSGIIQISWSQSHCFT